MLWRVKVRVAHQGGGEGGCEGEGEGEGGPSAWKRFFPLCRFVLLVTQ